MMTSNAQTGRRNTADFARVNHVKPQTVRKRYSATGSYFGIKPCKLPNGRLDWPSNEEAGGCA